MHAVHAAADTANGSKLQLEQPQIRFHLFIRKHLRLCINRDLYSDNWELPPVDHGIMLRQARCWFHDFVDMKGLL